jgi:hypothetical protein
MRHHPCRFVKGHRLVHPVCPEEVWGCGGDEQCQSLDAQRAAESSHVQAGQDHHAGPDQRWQHTQVPGADSQQAGFEPGKEWDDRREIHIPECGVAARVQVVQLVGVKAQSSVGREMDGQNAERSTAVQHHGANATVHSRGDHVFLMAWVWKTLTAQSPNAVLAMISFITSSVPPPMRMRRESRKYREMPVSAM